MSPRQCPYVWNQDRAYELTLALVSLIALQQGNCQFWYLLAWQLELRPQNGKTKPKFDV